VLTPSAVTCASMTSALWFRAFCDVNGNPIVHLRTSKRKQYKIERSMRLFYRLRYTHHRYMATRDPEPDSLTRAFSRSSAANDDVIAPTSQLQSISEAGLGTSTAFDTTPYEEVASVRGESEGSDLHGLRDILESVASVDDLWVDLRWFPILCLVHSCLSVLFLVCLSVVFHVYDCSTHNAVLAQAALEHEHERRALAMQAVHEHGTIDSAEGDVGGACAPHLCHAWHAPPLCR
jgi:hypothetical protein